MHPSSKKSLPFRLNQRGIYYGYFVLAFGTVGVLMSVPGQTMGISVYTESLLKAFGLTRNQLSFAYLLGTLTSAFLLPFAGRLLDRWGARVMGFGASLGLSFFLLGLSVGPQVAHGLAAWIPLPSVWISFLVIFFCFLGVRHFGQGQLTLASRTMMGLWFERRRGLMMGISGVFVAFGFGVSPLVLTHGVNQMGWRQSLVFLSVLLVFMAFFALLTFRRSPEHCGIEVDGAVIPSVIDESGAVAAPKNFTASEVKRMGVFWIFNAGLTAQALILTAITFHLTDIGRTRGVDNAYAFSLFLPVSFISVFSELLAGYLSDRIPLKYLLMVMQFSLFSGLYGLESFDHPLGFGLAAAGFGISGGLFALLNGAAWPKLFGRKYLGSIAGITTACLVGGSAVGPYLFSLAQSTWGTYSWVLWGVSALPGLIFFAALRANSPQA